MDRTYKTQAIILARKNFGEADRILILFTKHYGKIRVRAPGIRKTTSRKAAHLELFNLASLFLAQGKNLDIVTEATTLNNFSMLRKDLKKVSLAYYFCELVDGLCAEREENQEVFNLLLEAFRKLEIDGNDNLKDDFACRLLWNLGFLAKDKRLEGFDLENFIENLLERKIKSQRLLTRV